MIFTALTPTLALLGSARAPRLAGIIPAWQKGLGMIGAAGFFVAAVATIPAVEGALIGLLGFAAFLIWLVWLAMASIRLIRR